MRGEEGDDVGDGAGPVVGGRVDDEPRHGHADPGQHDLGAGVASHGVQKLLPEPGSMLRRHASFVIGVLNRR